MHICSVNPHRINGRSSSMPDDRLFPNTTRGTCIHVYQPTGSPLRSTSSMARCLSGREPARQALDATRESRNSANNFSTGYSFSLIPAPVHEILVSRSTRSPRVGVGSKKCSLPSPKAMDWASKGHLESKSGAIFAWEVDRSASTQHDRQRGDTTRERKRGSAAHLRRSRRSSTLRTSQNREMRSPSNGETALASSSRFV